MTKLQSGLRALFCVCFALAALSILSLSGYVLALLAVAAVWLLLRRGPLPRFTLLLLAGGFALRVCIALVLQPPLESDFLLLFEAAQSLLAGDLSFVDTPYFALWAYQSVFVAWEAAWLALWNDPLCLELVGAALASGTVCLLYRLARGWMSARAAQAACLLLTLFPFALTLHTVLTNQIASAFFLTLGVWLLVGEDCRRLGGWRFPLAGLALQCGNLLRSEGIIFVAALLAWAVFEAVRRPGAAKRLAAGMLALLAVYFAANGAADAAVRAAGLNPYGVQNGDPGWKFVTGLNFETSGGYSEEDWRLISPTLDENYQITAQTEAVQRALIAERLSAGPAQLARHLYSKLQLLWNADALGWVLDNAQQPGRDAPALRPHGIVYERICQLDRGLFYLAVLLAGLGLAAPRARWNQRPADACLPYFVFFAAFCALLLIEVQPRYAYLPQLFLFPAAGFGLDCLERSTKEEKGSA